MMVGETTRRYQSKMPVKDHSFTQSLPVMAHRKKKGTLYVYFKTMSSKQRPNQ